MSKWIDPDVVFARRAKLFVLSRSDLMAQGDLLREVKEAGPEAVERMLRLIIGAHRPELKDAILLAMHFRMDTMSWEVLAEHPSFPEVPPLQPLEPEPLIGWRTKEILPDAAVDVRPRGE